MDDRLQRAIGSFTAHAMHLSFGLIAIGVGIAAWMRAPLTWDGAYYFFLMLMHGVPMVAHDRKFDFVLHWPVVQVLGATGSRTAALAMFNAVHVLTPLIALLLCWLVLRNRKPELMFWPFLGILLVMLPGQINFISEGIKAEQLFWPLLAFLAVGLPWRTFPVAAALAVTIYWLHPAASPIFLAAAMAAIAFAAVMPRQRLNLVLGAVPLLVLAIMRYKRIGGSQAESELTWFTQERQFLNSVDGPTVVAVFCFLVMAAIQISRTWGETSRSSAADIRILVALGLAASALFIWAASPVRWWQALEYRGPAFWFTMIVAGMFVLSEWIVQYRNRPRAEIARWLYPAMAATFTLVISVQSVAWNGVLTDFEKQLAMSSNACVAREDVASWHRTPLNLWSTTPASLILQGQQPNTVSMTTEECHASVATGKIVIFNRAVSTYGDYLDLSMIESRLPDATACSWIETDGWHGREADWLNTWQWSNGAGELRIDIARTVPVEFRGELRTLNDAADVDVLVNDEHALTLNGTSNGTELDGTTFNLTEGENSIRLISDSRTSASAGDSRELSFALVNTSVRPADGSAPCVRLVP